MLLSLFVKKAAFKADVSKSGFITTSLAPVSARHHLRFGMLDAVLLLALIAGTITLMRLLLAR